MNGEMINYYFLKDVIKHIPSEIECELIYDDSLLFNFANFLNVPKFYCLYNLFKKDKYDLNKKFEEDFNTFFLECAIYLHQLNDYKRLFFLYSILAINNFKKRLNPYLEKVKDENDSFEKCYNMLDTYLANKEQIDLTTTPLYELFNKSFTQHYNKKFTKLCHEDKQTLVYVNDKFRIIILVDEKKLNLEEKPFLNRFEKHKLNFEILLNEKAKKIANESDLSIIFI